MAKVQERVMMGGGITMIVVFMPGRLKIVGQLIVNGVRSVQVLAAFASEDHYTTYIVDGQVSIGDSVVPMANSRTRSL